MAEFLQYKDAESLPIDHRLIAHIKNQDANKFESFEKLNLICFDLLDISNTAKDTVKITICQTKDKIYFIADEQGTLDKLKTYVKPESQPDKELYGFFSLLLKPDIDKMEELEEEVTDMEDVLLKDNRTDYTTGIISYRKKLLRLKRYYEQLSQAFDGVLENENQFISKENLKYFKFLDQKADRLLAHIVNIRDYITQVREAYQAQIDIEQNRLMKVFTVITAIFLPLTLIVGWYGMNVKMPEYSWPFGYLYVITLSVVVIVLLVMFFKKKKWF